MASEHLFRNYTVIRVRISLPLLTPVVCTHLSLEREARRLHCRTGNVFSPGRRNRLELRFDRGNCRIEVDLLGVIDEHCARRGVLVED